MKRRKFLQSAGMGAPAALAAASPAAQSGASGRKPGAEPRAFFYDDGRHASGLYQFAPPLEPHDLAFAVDQLVSSGIDTLIYSAGLEGGTVQYNSHVAAKWGDNVEVWKHEIFYRASRNLHHLIANGHDPMKLLCDRSHEKGLLFLPTLPVCIVGGDRAEDLGYGRKSDFVYDHPEFYVGEDPHPLAKQLGRFFGPRRMSFLHAEVRRERFLIFEELLWRYDSDGIEIDLSIDNEFGPFCRFAEVEDLKPVLTEWIRGIRRAARRAEEDQGRRKRVYVRIPAGGRQAWDLAGFDVPVWVREKLVDGFICITAAKKETPQGRRLLLDQDLDLAPVVALTRGTGVRVLAGSRGTLGRQLEANATREMIWASAALAYFHGADGFGLCDGMWAPNGWPWTSDDYQTLRLLGHPDMLATADKRYMARSLARGADSKDGLFPIEGPLLPQELAVGRSLTVPLTIADDLPKWSAQGRVKTVRLSLRLTNFELGLNEVEVEFNGRGLPDSIRRESDLHFRVVKNFALNPYGYVLEYLLPPVWYPKPGMSHVTVRLVRRDPKLTLPVELYDLDCAIEYRLHRHFQAEPVSY